MLEQPCVRSRGHIFSPIIMKLGQNVCLDIILDELKNGSCQVKTRSLGQILEIYCTLILYHTIHKAQVSNSRAMMALLFYLKISSVKVEKEGYYHFLLFSHLFVFSSTGRRPASLCHGPLSIVRPSVNFFFKHLLRLNYLSDFDEISQKCSHHGPLQNFLK